jgi:hypothetical protein
MEKFEWFITGLVSGALIIHVIWLIYLFLKRG